MRILLWMLPIGLLAGCGTRTCRVSGDACAVTNDCCSGLVCNGNTCGAAAACRASGAACGQTADCCSGLFCNGNRCTALPACRGSGASCTQPSDCCMGLTCNGRNQCAAAQCRTTGETCVGSPDCCNPLVCSGGKCGAAACHGLGGTCTGAGDCCNPLVCDGTYCTELAQCRLLNDACINTNDCCSPYVCAGGFCVDGTLAALTWNIDNSCYDGYGIEFRFYDETDNLVWPDNTNVYYVSSGEVVQTTLGCRLNNVICIGADQPEYNLYWGVSIDNTQQCQDCCFQCDNVTAGYTLTCD
jgi:hypothetical protein